MLHAIPSQIFIAKAKNYNCSFLFLFLVIIEVSVEFMFWYFLLFGVITCFCSLLEVRSITTVVPCVVSTSLVVRRAAQQSGKPHSCADSHRQRSLFVRRVVVEGRPKFGNMVNRDHFRHICAEEEKSDPKFSSQLCLSAFAQRRWKERHILYLQKHHLHEGPIQ